MQLVLNTHGAYLHRHEGMFRVKVEDQIHDVSAKKVESILISTSATISTDAIKLAMDYNIDIIFLDHFGEPYGRVWHSKLGSTTLIRRRQLEVADTEIGMELALEWIGNKFDNQIDYLTRLRENRTRKSSEITEELQRLREYREKLGILSGTIDEKRSEIMGLEGVSGRVYFQVLSFCLPEKFRFEGRSRNPAKDEFNCFLNYGYGVLYGLVEKACILAGLDPYVGIIHTDHYNKKSLVFDLIENYRIWTDETVMGLFSSRKIEDSFFQKIEGGMVLDKPGKTALLEALNEFLDTAVRYRGRNIKRRDIIQFDCHRIANKLIGKEIADEEDRESGVGAV